MPTLKGLYAQAQAGSDLVVTGPHYDWLERLEHEQMPSARAMAFQIRAALRDFKHPRPGRFSPSSMGECPRRIMFDFAGAPALGFNVDNQEMMDHGTVSHLKWQVEGLTMGYMTQAEVWVEDTDLMAGGSMDAELSDGSLFELKSAGPWVYNKVVLDGRAPKWENLLQIGTYFILSDKDWASVVYEDRGTGQFHEFRVQRDPKIEREVLRRLASYKRYAEDDALPPQLADCEIRMGTVFKRCPYRGMCHIPDSITTAATMSESESRGRRTPLAGALPQWAQLLLKTARELEEL
jgi:hypothetical protein